MLICFIVLVQVLILIFLLIFDFFFINIMYMDFVEESVRVESRLNLSSSVF